MPEIDIGPIHETPLTSSTERMHVLNADCWCDPVVEQVPARVRHRTWADAVRRNAKEI